MFNDGPKKQFHLSLPWWPVRLQGQLYTSSSERLLGGSLCVTHRWLPHHKGYHVIVNGSYLYSILGVLCIIYRCLSGLQSCSSPATIMVWITLKSSLGNCKFQELPGSHKPPSSLQEEVFQLGGKSHNVGGLGILASFKASFSASNIQQGLRTLQKRKGYGDMNRHQNEGLSRQSSRIERAKI